MNLTVRALIAGVLLGPGVALSGCSPDSDSTRELTTRFASSDDIGAERVFEQYDRSGNFTGEIKTPAGKPLMAIRIDCVGPGSVEVQLGRKRAVGSAGSSLKCDEFDGEPSRLGAQDLGTDTVISVKQTGESARWSVAVDLYDEMNRAEE